MKKLIRKLTAWAWAQEIDVSEGIAKLKSLNMDEKGMEIAIKQDPDLAKYIVSCFAFMVAESPNYTEMKFELTGRYADKFQFLNVLIQKHNGKSPHELRIEAENQAKEYLDILAAIQKSLFEAGQIKDNTTNKQIVMCVNAVLASLKWAAQENQRLKTELEKTGWNP